MLHLTNYSPAMLPVGLVIAQVISAAMPLIRRVFVPNPQNVPDASGIALAVFVARVHSTSLSAE